MHNRPMFEWDDVKYFLAVARHGSTLWVTDRRCVPREFAKLTTPI